MANNFGNKVQKNEEVKNYVRKASEFSLDELKLSKRTRNCVKNIPPEELILMIRRRDLHIKGMWKVCYDELYTAVDAVGFIRHFETKSFAVGRLYCALIGRCLNGKLYGHPLQFESNGAYENYRCDLSDEQIKAVNQLLDDALTRREKKVVQLFFGLIDGKRRYMSDVGAIIHSTCEHAWHIEREALHKLRRPSNFLKLKGILGIN